MVNDAIFEQIPFPDFHVPGPTAQISHPDSTQKHRKNLLGRSGRGVFGARATNAIAAAVLRSGAAPVEGVSCSWPMGRGIIAIGQRQGLRRAGDFLEDVPDVWKSTCRTCLGSWWRRRLRDKVRYQDPG